MNNRIDGDTPIDQLKEVMRRLRAPDGCPWDKEQDHMSIRFHAVEEVYELIDAIEADDNQEMLEELGDLLLQVIFHSQLASEKGHFDFDKVAQTIVEKLIRRHPHVFGDNKDADNADKVLSQWEQIKKAEKEGTSHQRDSALDGIPNHLPALAKTEKLVKKARKAGLMPMTYSGPLQPMSGDQIAGQLFELTSLAQSNGLSAEALLRDFHQQMEASLRAAEANAN